jgi:amino acid adenylation domain-containing protein/non-ribosomal peptide synthase protein (TIGR01720 family)
MNTATNLIEILRQRSIHTPQRVGYVFLKDGTSNTELSLSYHELDLKIRRLAAQLQQVATPNDRAILFYPQGLDYVIAFYACLYAGVIAIPTYPPHHRRPDKRIQSIVKDAQPMLVLTTSAAMKHKDEYIKNTPELAQSIWIDSTKTEDIADNWEMPDITANQIAFLQYTSGSTGQPKGVQVSHDNIMHNSEYIKTAFQLSEQSVSVTWLPSFHDMGLIDGIIQPVYCGFLGVIMPSVKFLQKPLLWLQNIAHYKATHCGGPNFGYDLCVQKISDEERQQLDLSHWYSAYNGAEPINQATLERFTQTFAECGFKPNYFYPCYGMAETTLMVSGGELEQTYRTCVVDANRLGKHQVVKLNSDEYRDKKTVREIVSCGHIWLDAQVEIVNPETLQRCQANEVGEIWVKSKSVTQGYWQKPEINEEIFNACIANTNEKGFLRTGDLGFIDDGELFVTGRLKDVIIIRGRNYYPQDIEATMEKSHFTLKNNACAAFSVEIDGEEKLIVAVEVERRYNRERRKKQITAEPLERRHRPDRRQSPYEGYEDDRDEPLNPQRVIETIRQNISEQHGLQVHAVLLLRVGSIPKTSSGKIQRHACRQGFLQGSLNVVGSDILNVIVSEQQNTLTRALLLVSSNTEHRTLVSAYIHDLICHLLHIPSYYFDWQHTINKLGIDSLIAVELQHRIETDLGVHVPMSYFLQDTTVAALVDYVLNNVQQPMAKPEHIENTAFQALSYNQQALWFLNKLAPDSAAYNIFFAVDITTAVNVNAMQQAFQSLLDRHPTLRTNFYEQMGQPIQKVHTQFTVDFELIECSTWSESKLNQYLTEQAHQAFDLEKDSLMRIRLCQQSNESYVLLWVVHHICVDLWSMTILLDELKQYYSAYSQNNNNIVLPEIKTTYVDFAYWQQTMLNSDKGDAQAQYWLQKLSGELPILDLPLDFPRPAIQTYTGASIGFKLDTKILQALRAIVKTSGTTLYILLLSIFQVLLHRYTQQDDIVIGSPSAGRCHADFNEVIGYFTNMLAMRADLSENPSFNGFLSQMQTTVLEALENQHYPFQLLVDKLSLERDPSRTPLFQVAFGLQKPHKMTQCAPFVLREKGANMMLGNLPLESRTLEQKIAQFDMTLIMVESDDNLIGSWEYNSALFKPETIQRMITHFQTLISSIINEPEQRISEFNLLPDSEQQQLAAWNVTDKLYPQQCVHQLFEQQAEKTPDNIAVAFAAQSLTYQQLNEKSNQLAHYLQNVGIKPESLVAICVERSVELIIGLLGILKSGGAFVPLDAKAPQQRLRFMLQDTNAKVLLTQNHLLTILPEHQAQTICLDTDWDKIAQNSHQNPNVNIKPDNLAYVIYTSGSTGQPKGTLLEHRGFSNFTQWHVDYFNISTNDRTAQLANVTFDVSIWEIFPTLIAGSQLILSKPDIILAGQNLSEFLNNEKVSIASMTPSVLAAINEVNLPFLKTLAVGGEKCPEQLITVWANRDISFINAYGPTEATVCTTALRYKNTNEVFSIGRPIANTNVFILDKHLQQVPIGVVGELCIGGVNLARGYLNRPDLTAEKFITSPFNPQQRIYKTGDLVRYLPDGNIEYLGRIDHQVKIRGFRIELGEIENVLNSYPTVETSYIIVQQQNNEKRIVAYFVAQQPIQADDLRTFILQSLPDYMLPKVFIQLDKLPLTANGKIDRKALPEPTLQRDSQTQFIAPRNEIEQILANIWSELLNIEKIGVNDNFFSLGGDSILSIQVVARANQQHIKLTPQLVFQYQTIAQLAAIAEIDSHTQAKQDLIIGDVPLTPIQHWFFAQNLANPHYYNQSVLLTLAPNIQADLLEKAFQHLLIHHDALRLQFEKIDGQWQQRNIAEAATFHLKVITLQNDEQLVSETQKLQASLNIEQAALINATLLSKSETTYLFVVVHHLAIDGVSWRILLEDLMTAYQQLLQGQKITLPLKTTAFQDWAHYLQQYAQQIEPAFWLQQSASMSIPTDFNSELFENTVQSSAEITVSLSREQTTDLLQNISDAYNTKINDILLTALSLSLSEWTQQSTILFDLEAHGRDSIDKKDIDLSRTIGWFTCLYPVVLQLESNGDLATNIKSIKEQLRQIPNNGIDYGVLRYLSSDATIRQQLQALPAAQISFNYLGQFDQNVQNTLFSGMNAEKTAFYHAENNQRAYLLDFNLMVLNEQLHITCHYSLAFHHPETIERLLNHYQNTLQSLIQHCLDPQAMGYTPSDFPDADLNQDELDNLLEQL